MWLRLFMVFCFVWNLFNLLYYTSGIYQHQGYVGAVLYTLLCLLGMGWCVRVWVRDYKKQRKQSCEK